MAAVLNVGWCLVKLSLRHNRPIQHPPRCGYQASISMTVTAAPVGQSPCEQQLRYTWGSSSSPFRHQQLLLQGTTEMSLLDKQLSCCHFRHPNTVTWPNPPHLWPPAMLLPSSQRLPAGRWKGPAELSRPWRSLDGFSSPSSVVEGAAAPRGWTRAGVCWQGRDTQSSPCDCRLPRPSGSPSGESEKVEIECFCYRSSKGFPNQWLNSPPCIGQRSTFSLPQSFVGRHRHGRIDRACRARARWAPRSQRGKPRPPRANTARSSWSVAQRTARRRPCDLSTSASVCNPAERSQPCQQTHIYPNYQSQKQIKHWLKCDNQHDHRLPRGGQY